ncbi:actin-related protein 8-like [Humulus lupulus]|uniref:actin-related protein 8-like n=1 Tax=Humulus lupulus TaxID=3486 RepID=UPI002B40F5A5|nr:actin-related protein 8-like [Humulus lupulus]
MVFVDSLGVVDFDDTRGDLIADFDEGESLVADLAERSRSLLLQVSPLFVPSSPLLYQWRSLFCSEKYLKPTSCFTDSQMKNGLFSFPDPNKILRCDRTIQSFAKTGEGGSGYCKYDWRKYAAPSVRSATFLEFGNIESPMYTRLRPFFSTIYSRMQVRAPSQPVVVSIPILHYDDTESAKASRRQLKEAMYTTLFNMNVPAVCAINQATLALYAARRTSGIVVNIGFQVTSVVPILHGKVMHKVGVEVVGLGALKLTGFLKELMQQNNISFESLYTVRTLKKVQVLLVS